MAQITPIIFSASIFPSPMQFNFCKKNARIYYKILLYDYSMLGFTLREVIQEIMKCFTQFNEIRFTKE
jgi:hypothetical protein